MSGKPKMKTNRGAGKRFRVTKNGKIKREQACLNHLRTSKTRRRKRRLRQQTLVSDSDLRRVKHLIAM